jgi:hypothetical protein
MSIGRPRAGNGWTSFTRGQRGIKLIFLDDGRLATTGVAAGWPRCIRCRGPYEQAPFGSGACPTCYFYHMISIEDFWRLHKAGYPLAPYNIWQRNTMARFDMRPLSDPKVNWRDYLRNQPAPPPLPMSDNPKDLAEPARVSR